MGCRVVLKGKGSSLKTDIGYMVNNDGRLDMNYEAVHEGKVTESEINAAGVLKNGAFKLFRGTIDFKKGAAGAVGNEKEDVLLLDDNVVNQTIPIILCAEEDVEGNHGATIGEIDEQIMLYMQARGLSREQVYEEISKVQKAAAVQVSKAPDLVPTGMYKVVIIAKLTRYDKLRKAMNDVGVTGMTVTQVMGCGIQKGAGERYRGAEVDATLLPKVKVEVIVGNIPVENIIEAAKKALYT